MSYIQDPIFEQPTAAGDRSALLLLAAELPPAACWSNQNFVFEFQDPFDFRFDLVIIMHQRLHRALLGIPQRCSYPPSSSLIHTL